MTALSTDRIVIDKREKQPYPFEGAAVIFLKTGDYSIAGYEDRVCVERKRVAEMFACAGRNRARFERELVRMSKMDYAAIVIEGDMRNLLERDDYSKVSPKAVINSVISWSVQHNVNVWLAGNRTLGRAATYRILEKFWKYRR